MIAMAVALSGCATMSELLDELSEAAANPERSAAASAARSESVSRAGGQLIPTATIDPASLRTIAWHNGARNLGLDGRLDQEFAFNCPSGGALTWNVWGTDVYSTGSSVCIAAVHARRITARDGGVVIIRIVQGQASYTGSARAGVTSRSGNQTAWAFEFISNFSRASDEPDQRASVTGSTGVSPAANLRRTAETDPSLTRLAPWGRSVSNLGVARNLGQDFAFFCPPGGALGGRVWGDAVYHPNSSLCDAAVHEGRISAREGGHVIVAISSGLASHAAANRNGVTSLVGTGAATSYRFIDHSPDLAPVAHPFEIVDAVPASAALIPNGRWNMAFSQVTGLPGTVFRMTCPSGGQIGTVVGSEFYHPRSSICTSAVHAGLINPREGGEFGIQVFPARGYFLGGTANGINSDGSDRADRSFRLLPVRPETGHPERAPFLQEGGVQDPFRELTDITPREMKEIGRLLYMDTTGSEGYSRVPAEAMQITRLSPTVFGYHHGTQYIGYIRGQMEAREDLTPGEVSALMEEVELSFLAWASRQATNFARGLNGLRPLERVDLMEGLSEHPEKLPTDIDAIVRSWKESGAVQIRVRP